MDYVPVYHIKKRAQYHLIQRGNVRAVMFLIRACFAVFSDILITKSGTWSWLHPESYFPWSLLSRWLRVFLGPHPQILSPKPTTLNWQMRVKQRIQRSVERSCCRRGATKGLGVWDADPLRLGFRVLVQAFFKKHGLESCQSCQYVIQLLHSMAREPRQP